MARFVLRSTMRVLPAVALVAIATTVVEAQVAAPQPKAALGVTMTLTPNDVRIVRVVPGSPADRAGLLPGDRIIAINQEAIVSHQDVIRIIGSSIPNSIAAITVERGNLKGTLNATLSTDRNVFTGRRPTRANGPLVECQRSASGGQLSHRQHQGTARAGTRQQ